MREAKPRMFAFLNQRFWKVLMSLAIVGPGIIALSLNDIRYALASKNWPCVQGKIIRVLVKCSKDIHGSVNYFGLAEYQYDVDNKPYVSQMTYIGPPDLQSDEAHALADVAQYHANDTAMVYYNPADPSFAVLQTGMRPVRKALLIGACAATMIGIASCIFVRRQSSRDMLKAQIFGREAQTARVA